MRYIVRIDDFPMNRDHKYDEGLILFKELDAVFKEYKIPYILAVIPNLLTAESSFYLMENSGRITMAQHGHNHHKIMDGQMRSEFIEISFDEKLQHIREGDKLIKSWLKQYPNIFIPPMNWFDEDMIKILKCLGFEYLLGYGIEMPKNLGSKLTHIPCSPKFYNPASKIIPMIEEMEDIDGLSFITLHCNWEYPLSSAPETLCKLIKDKIIDIKEFDFRMFEKVKNLPKYDGMPVSRKMGFDWILERVSSGFKIMEFGCGDSLLPTILSLKGNKVTAVDIDEEKLNKQTVNMANWKTKYDCVVADGRNLPFPDNSFDIITASQSILCAVDDDEKVVKELCRTLRPNGYLLFSNKFSNKETYIETKRQDPLKVRNWTDIEEKFIKSNKLRIIDKAFSKYEFDVNKGEWCSKEEANCVCVEVKK